MQRKYLYLLPFLIMALSSCFKDSADNTPLPTPEGTFSGQFRILHKSNLTGKVDTTKADFSLEISQSTGFKVVSDTTKIHAGSNGDWAMNPQYVVFIDKTSNTAGVPPAKIHLSGTYVYQYDGSSVFQFYTIPSDTIMYQYDLKKVVK